MPLIRYEIGDLGVLSREPCACGRCLLTLKSIAGRTQDALRNHAGQLLPALYFASFFRDMRGVKAYQIIQHDLVNVTLKIVTADPAEVEKDRAGLCEAIARHLGGGTQIKVELCASIPLTARGKLRLIMGLNP